MKILLVEDEKINRITMADALVKQGYDVRTSETGEQALEMIAAEYFPVIITDLRLPGVNGLEILEFARSRSSDTEVIIMTAFATVETAVQALKIGAYDYLIKPFNIEELITTLSHIQRLRSVITENVKLRERLSRFESREIIGHSPAIRHLMNTIASVGPNDSSVLITGESGTGKEMAARALHQQSPRAAGPFIAVNSASLPETLMESELFGYEKGSFSGALKQHRGYFERAGGGTIFIDDVDDMPVSLQVKLLRVLQEREIVRIGGDRPIAVDIRLIAAAKEDLKQLVDSGHFRQDLYYRLNVVPVFIPPLRQRKEDIPLLLDFFLTKYNATAADRERTVGLLDQFLAHDWPGNVRELENIVQRIIALRGAEFATPPFIGTAASGNEDIARASGLPGFDEQLGYDACMEAFDRDVISRALDRVQQNVTAAARLLGIPRSTLRSKMEKYHLQK